MPQHVYTFRWDDADAPVLTGEVGTMAHLLRKCLGGEGYGSGQQAKEGAGWEVVWDSTTNARLAFRSSHPEAADAWYYVDDTGTVGAGGARWARIWMMEGFAGWDGNGDPIYDEIVPTVAQSSWGRTLAKSFQENSTPAQWILLTDGRAVQLYVDHYHRTAFTHVSYSGSAHFIGAVRRIDGLTAYALCCGVGENILTQNFGGHWPLTAAEGTTSGMYILRGVDGALGAELQPVGGNAGYTENRVYPCPLTGGLLAVPRGLVTVHAGGLVFFANLPGLLQPIQRAPILGLSVVEVQSRAYLYCSVAAGSGRGAVLADTEGPWHE